MGKATTAFVEGLPRLGSGTTYSADAVFRTDILEGFSLEESAYYSDLSEYVPRDVACLRTWVVFKAARSLGKSVGDFSFRLMRFCVVEPSHVVVLAPVLGVVVLEDFLMPVTKREKQLMLSLRGEDFEDPAVASFGNEKILPFIATPGLSGTRFFETFWWSCVNSD